MQQFVEQIIQTFGGYLLNFGGAVLILVGGWFLALIVSAVVRKALERTSIDNHLAQRLGMDPSEFNIEVMAGKIVYWLIMLFVLVAVFQTLRLTVVTGPLNRLLEEIFEFVPNLLAAGGLLLVAWLIATFLKFIVSKGLGATKLDDTLTSQVGLVEEGQTPMSETLANIVYWFIFLLFLLPILGALEMDALLDPIQDMVYSLLGFLPNVLGASIFVLVGWFVARILRQIITSLLVAVGADSLGERVGITGEQTLSAIIGTVVYAIVLLLAIIQGLDALKIEAISGPATAMLTTLLEAIPNIFGAMIILGVTYLIGQLVSGLVTSILTNIGFNKVLSLIGLKPAEGQRTPAEVVGYLVVVGLMLFATVEAANLLGFTILADLVANFLSFTGDIVLGVIIFGLGLYLANVACNVVLGTAGTRAVFLSQLTRLSIIILSTAMALRQMGIAYDIVNLAFGLLLGAIAVAVALAFGLGAREIAAREVESWIKQLRSTTDDDQQPQAQPDS